MKVLIKIREVYGQVRAYPANDTAQLFAALVGTKTLNPEHLQLIKSLGFTVEVAAPEIPASFNQPA